MKALRLTALTLVLLAVFLALNVEITLADGPVASVVPGNVPFIDNQIHTIQPNANALYRFNYSLSDSGKTQMTTITLLYGNKSGVGFEVWSAEAVTNVADNDPFGRGMPGMTPCDTGWCATDDLVWTGALGATGPYYIRVVNNNSWGTTFMVTISGKGVNLALPIAVTGPSTVPTTNNLDDPLKAVFLDGKQQIVPANSAMWFSYTYAIGDYTNRPFNLIRLLYGAKTGLKFEVYSPEILATWWENKPIGMGTIEMKACDTGWCSTDNLAWAGSFGSAGTYFVRVINKTAYDLPFTLSLQ